MKINLNQDWRLVGFISILIPCASSIGIYFYLPESPRWCLSNGREHEAKLFLMQLRGLKEENEDLNNEFASMILYSKIEYEGNHTRSNQNFEDLSDEIKKQNRIKESAYSNIFQGIWSRMKLCRRILMIPQVWKPFIIINVFFLAQQFCGLYVIMAYSVNFLTMVGVKHNANIVSVIIGLLQMTSIMLLIFCSDK